MNSPLENANISLGSSLILSLVSWITPANADLTFKILTFIGAMAGVVFSIRYHIAAKKLKDKELENLEKEDEEDKK